MIDRFTGPYAWLSNFWPCEIEFEGLTYPSVENAYQSMKFNPVERKPFAEMTPGQAKRLGQKVDLDSDWHNRKYAIMFLFLGIKFRPGTQEAEWLMSTGDEEIVEGNTWGDTYWGVCNGVGENKLGELLMIIRKALIEHYENLL